MNTQISTVICELNPIHSGHRYIFEKARQYSDTVVAVMSGNFVQRGECAVYDKYSRAKSAVAAGADLVLELPFPWCCGSAEYFARAGVYIAEKIGTDKLVFGSECGDISALRRAAEILRGKQFNEPLAAGVRAAERRLELLREADPTLPDELLRSPNDILAAEYCKNVTRAEPVAVKRVSAETASEIRRQLISDKAESIGNPSALAELEFALYRCRKEPITATAESSGGVGERLYSSAFGSDTGVEMLERAKTKIYTDARLRRAALFALTDVKNEQLRQLPCYTTVLAANEKGKRLLAARRGAEDLEIVTKPAYALRLPGEAGKQFAAAAFADSIYTLTVSPRLPGDYFTRQSPYII